MRIHHLDCGTMCPLAGRLTGGDSWLRPGRMICRVLLVETEHDGLVLVDTGFGLGDTRDRRAIPLAFRALTRPVLDPAQTAFEQVRARGLSTGDVRHVVITHLDLDHAGGLADFPGATVHLHRHEQQAAMRRATAKERGRYVARQWAHGPRWATYEAEGDRWLELPAVRALDGMRAEIALVPLHGHTRGHSGVAVKDGDGWLLHAGDALFHHGELTGEPVPLGLRAIATIDEVDRAARRAAVAALRSLALRPEVTIVCSHDPTMPPATS